MDKKGLDNPQESNTIVYTLSWNKTKSARLKRIRGISFEEIIHSKCLGIEDNPARDNQKMFIFEYRGYIWAVPFVREGAEVFLKTLYPSRKFSKVYRKRRGDEENKID